MSNRKPKLKPCPFCGELPSGPLALGNRLFRVMCCNALCAAAPFVTRDSRRGATGQWNTRRQSRRKRNA